MDVANLYGFADSVLDWSYVKRGKPIFSFDNYNEYAKCNRTFAFFLDDSQSIWDYGSYEGHEDRCPEEFHFDASDVLAPYLCESFQSNNLMEMLLNG